MGFLQERGVVSARVETDTPHTSPEGCFGHHLIVSRLTYW